ncbi:hypothetical protein [Methylobacterium nonmethylotrophicum]|uniref:Uncharacterized protein n=1 Tax=Methylobacterium nonmethylotrophicum TaxID=1141884 RepID=A0A4Z0NEW7_9HYPH|nr:hypothetical protein [Methylobacterium nonmethylotrophicum]TGD94826.1 hypothetical protein EU555_30700 [Methylobacterium nonmethylotrophicum]
MRLFLVPLLTLAGLGIAQAEGLTSAGTAAQDLCFASGSSGPRVPCALQGSTWVRTLQDGGTGDVSGMTVTPRGGSAATRLADLAVAPVPFSRLPAVPGYSLLCNTSGASAVPGPCNRFTAQDHTNTPDQAATFSFQRVSTYTGGSSGFENAAVRIINRVSPGNANYEDGLLSIIDNYANTAAQNASGRFTANQWGTSGTWSLANETTDHTKTADPRSPLLGIEQIVAANGTDAHSARVGLDIVIARPHDGPGHAYSGPAATMGVGLRLVRQVADRATANRFGIGLAFGSNFVSTDFDRGIDFRFATFSTGGPAINLAQGQSIAFTANNDRSWRFNNGLMTYDVGGRSVYGLTDSGNIVSAGDSLRLASQRVPASATATCSTGEMSWGTDGSGTSYVYVCVATNRWKRSALTSW